MPLPEFIARQGRCPTGLLGGLVARVMAWETAGENDAALELLELQPADHVLEIGFGHGRTIAKAAARVPNGLVAGVDPSEGMMRMARRHNQNLIAAGRVELRQGDTGKLPYPAGHFDKVYSVHTLYFWTQPAEGLREIARVMKPGARLLVGFRSRDDEHVRNRLPSSTHTLYTADEVRGLLTQAGFEPVRIVERRFSARRLVFFALAERPLAAQ
jgi:ubiquinone/menaquinone biosynthesis C-methylase UbiE